MKWLFSICIVISFTYNVDAQIQKDKLEHFSIGAGITLLTTETVFKITKNRRRSIFIGLGAGVVSGAVKELYDNTGRGNQDVKDFLWTSLGSSLSALTFVIKF
jgi:hypothetical protein